MEKHVLYVAGAT